VLYPCDANQTATLVPAMADRSGITYLRTTRGNTPVIYGPGEEFPVGGSKVLRSDPADQVTLIGAGVTLHQALAAGDRLADEGIKARVIDLYSVKPVDFQTLREAAEATGRFVTVEDHHPEGGIADAVLESFGNGHPMPLLTRLAVHSMPGSATPEEQLHAAGIDAHAITAAARKLVSGR
jgi:transketolase